MIPDSQMHNWLIENGFLSVEDSDYGMNLLRTFSSSSTRYGHGTSERGYHRETIPSLDSLAEESLHYEWAWSPTIWTLPSHVSFFTALEVDEHGVDGLSKALVH